MGVRTQNVCLQDHEHPSNSRFTCLYIVGRNRLQGGDRRRTGGLGGGCAHGVIFCSVKIRFTYLEGHVELQDGTWQFCEYGGSKQKIKRTWQTHSPKSISSIASPDPRRPLRQSFLFIN